MNRRVRAAGAFADPNPGTVHTAVTLDLGGVTSAIGRSHFARILWQSSPVHRRRSRKFWRRHRRILGKIALRGKKCVDFLLHLSLALGIEATFRWPELFRRDRSGRALPNTRASPWERTPPRRVGRDLGGGKTWLQSGWVLRPLARAPRLLRRGVNATTSLPSTM